mgnify:FL=1
MSIERSGAPQHDTLDEIPEPAENPVLFGHEEVAARLARAHRARKLHHALVLAGPRGIGKATLAFHLAYHLLRHPDAADAPETLAAPDPETTLFKLIANGGHPSVLHLTRPLNERTKAFRTAVTVEEIRKVQRFLSYTAHDGGYRVVIIDPADDMNQNAANALLKSLEEPPARTQFILISHAAGGLLPTIRSRCQIVRLQPLDETAFASALANLGIAPQDTDTAKALTARAGGSVREAILLTQYGGLEIAAAIEEIATGARFDVAKAWRLADAAAARDRTMALSLFNRHVLDHAAALAVEAAHSGALARADALSQFWQDANRAIVEAETYNLDKRQHVAGLMRAMHAALAG